MGLISDALDVRKNGEFIKNDEEHWNDQRTVLIALEAAAGIWTKQSFAFGLFSTAGLTLDLEALSLPARGMIDQVIVKSSTAFVGTGVTALTAAVGIGGELDRYLGLYDLLAGVSGTNFLHTVSNELRDFGAAESIRLQLTATSANLDQLTVGAVDVYTRSTTLPV